MQLLEKFLTKNFIPSRNLLKKYKCHFLPLGLFQLSRNYLCEFFLGGLERKPLTKSKGEKYIAVGGLKPPTSDTFLNGVY
jgi:hypothetical protein